MIDSGKIVPIILSDDFLPKDINRANQLLNIIDMYTRNRLNNIDTDKSILYDYVRGMMHTEYVALTKLLTVKFPTYYNEVLRELKRTYEDYYGIDTPYKINPDDINVLVNEEEVINGILSHGIDFEYYVNPHKYNNKDVMILDNVLLDILVKNKSYIENVYKAIIEYIISTHDITEYLDKYSKLSYIHTILTYIYTISRI